jgi:hypothetical protein
MYVPSKKLLKKNNEEVIYLDKTIFFKAVPDDVVGGEITTYRLLLRRLYHFYFITYSNQLRMSNINSLGTCRSSINSSKTEISEKNSENARFP